MSNLERSDRGRGRRLRPRGHQPPERVDPPPVAGRPPPHDLDAEAAVLSAMLLDRDALDRVLDVLKPEHFYSEANARIFQACQQISLKREPVDIIAVKSWLRDREWIEGVGGLAYLAQLADATPAVGHVLAHAKVVHETWLLRSLIGTFERLSAEARFDVGDVGEFVKGAAEAVDDLVQTRVSHNHTEPLSAVLKAAFEQITKAAESGNRITGIPTGYDRLDAKTAGMHEGDLIIVAARPGMGKAQPLDAKVLTPTGWRTMGELAVGDVLTNPWGGEQRVSGIYPQGRKQVWAVSLAHGRSTKACDEHLWSAAVSDPNAFHRPVPKIYTTAQLRDALRVGHTVQLPISPQANHGGWPSWALVETIAPAGEEECQCIAVDSDRRLYVTDDFIVTHNTSFVLNVATNVASPRTITLPATQERAAQELLVPGLGVCVFSLEMPREQLATRMVCSEGRVDLGRLRQGHLHAEDWRKLTEAAQYLSTLPVWIDDTPGLDLRTIRAKALRIKSSWEREATETEPARKIGLIVIDYLQLMKGREGVNSREQEISEISRGLKELAKELKVPVVALSQLNRAVETRSTKDKRPQLSDLRESGAIEQDADTIVFIFRDEYYNPDTDLKGIAELIIAKQRNGPTGKVKVRFASSYTRFDNLEPADYPESEEE